MKNICFAILLFWAFCVCPVSSSNIADDPPQPEQGDIPQIEEKAIRDFRLSIGGGYSLRTGRIEKTGDNKLDDLSRDIRHGFNIDSDLQCFFKESWGAGLGVNYSNSSGTAENVYIPGIGTYNKVKETQHLIYVGPTFSMRSYLGNLTLFANIGLGPLFFIATDNFDGQDLSLNKTTVGFQTNIALEYKIARNTGLGLKLNLIGGSVKMEGFEDDRMNVSTLQIGGYLSFRSW